jgi:enediyne polyketide synthase
VRAARLLLLGGPDEDALSRQIDELRSLAAGASSIGDLPMGGPAPGDDLALRAAVVAGDTEELEGRLGTLAGWLAEAGTEPLRAERGVALGRVQEGPRIGFLFPGQGAPVPRDSGYLREWIPEAATVYERAPELGAAEEVPPELVQLSVVTASVAGLRALATLGIEAEFGLGHSVGELTALHWAGALDEDAALRIARRRGETMTEHATAEGAMANIEAGEETFSRIVDGANVTVACVNSPRHRVVSGASEEVDAVVARAREEDGTRVVRLRVVGAFHSPLMEKAVPVFERQLGEESFGRLQRPVYSTITGAELQPVADLRALLVDQMTQPVQFLEAARDAINGTHLLLEVGPGRMLSGLVAEFSDTPAVPLRVGHSSPQGLLTAVGAAFAIGVPVRADRLPAA